MESEFCLFFEANTKKQIITLKPFHKALQLRSINTNVENISILDIIRFLEILPECYLGTLVKGKFEKNLIRSDIFCTKCNNLKIK